MKRFRIVIEVELSETSDLVDAVEVAQQAAALLLQHDDRRIEGTRPLGVEEIDSPCVTT